MRYVDTDSGGGDREVLSKANFGSGSYASFTSPKGSRGRVFYAFQRVADVEAGQSARSVTSILLSYRIETGDKSLADPPAAPIAGSAVDENMFAFHEPDAFAATPPGRVTLVDDLDFED